MDYHAINNIEWFEYRGIKYAKGTEVVLSKHIMQKYVPYIQEQQTVIFLYRSKIYNDVCFLIPGKYNISVENNEEHIKKIVRPIYYKQKPAIDSAIENYKTKKRTPDVFNGTVWYLIICGFLLFCVDGFIGIAVATIVYVNWLINKYKD